MAAAVRLYSADDIVALAEEVLARNRVRRPPVDVDAIARGEGLRYEHAPFYVASGTYYREPDGSGTAVISTQTHRLRQRFTKAHELGHHLMDEPRGPRSLVVPDAYRSGRPHNRHWHHEFFAANMLMPRGWVGSFMRQRGWRFHGDDLVREVARTFDVSWAAAQVRLRELGHIE